MTATQTMDLAELIREDRVHSAYFTDEAILEAEMERIFHGWWQYVGHESEVPEPGDYCLKRIGRQAVIMSRDREGQVHLLMNRCRHRGAVVCHHESGNANFLRCAFHGWTYRSDGTLVGVPYPRAYGERFDKAQLGLTKVARVGEHRGFLFGSLADGGIGFDEYIRPAMPYLDAFVKASPVGRIELRAGKTRARFEANWKLVGQDGYHPAFTHVSLQDMIRRTDPAKADALWQDYDEESTDHQSIDLGGGHARLREKQDGKRVLLNSLRAGGDAVARYYESLDQVYGAGQAEVVVTESDPHIAIFPNLHLLGGTVKVIRPVSAGVTEVECYPAMLAGAPDEVNTARLRAQEWFHGPASFGAPDDQEVFERVQRGLTARVDPWVLLSRGLDREVPGSDGTRIGNITDEVPQRGQLRNWLRIMGTT
jgi:phenylpropionate dioxygenase-like ring-hydroxylating dioxygenase large terminal subunit